MVALLLTLLAGEARIPTSDIVDIARGIARGEGLHVRSFSIKINAILERPVRMPASF
jgi:hypothetical protein